MSSETVSESVPPSMCLPARNWKWFALRGVLLLALAILALIFPGPALFAFALVFAAFCFADGIFSLISGVRGARRKTDRWWTLILSGLVGIAVGVMFFLFPLLGTVAYAFVAIMLVAGWAIITGLLQIVAAWRIRREIEGEWALISWGALSVLLGLALAAMLWIAPAPTLLSVGWIIGIWALAGGIALLVFAYRVRGHDTKEDREPASA